MKGEGQLMSGKSLLPMFILYQRNVKQKDNSQPIVVYGFCISNVGRLCWVNFHEQTALNDECG